MLSEVYHKWSSRLCYIYKYVQHIYKEKEVLKKIVVLGFI